jgi:hypothetical protein
MTTITKPSQRRHDVFAFGDRLRAERQQWQNPTFVARQLLVALGSPTLAGDPDAVISRSEAAREFARLHPAAVQRLGEAVVAGAAPERSACRWCAATLFSVVHRKPPPNPANPGVRLLLGEPCSHTGRLTQAERREMMRRLSARVAPSRTAVKRAEAAKLIQRQRRQLIASGRTPGYAVGDPASWRAWARKDLANRAPWATTNTTTNTTTGTW